MHQPDTHPLSCDPWLVVVWRCRRRHNFPFRKRSLPSFTVDATTQFYLRHILSFNQKSYIISTRLLNFAGES